MAFGRTPDRVIFPLEPVGVERLVSAYNDGERDFSFVVMDGADLSNLSLDGANFYGSSLRGANFSFSSMEKTEISSADCSGAYFTDAYLRSNNFAGTSFLGAKLKSVSFVASDLAHADFVDADLSFSRFWNTKLESADFRNAKLLGVSLGPTYFTNLDVGPFCDARRVRHRMPSVVDARTVIKSHGHPRLQRFMLDCGVPDIFATYMIECAAASNEAVLKSMMQSTFISYGAPDEPFARKVYEFLRAHNVVTFFFPETATLGERINNEVFSRIQQHDRILLVCSRHSLDRPGVVNEIQETLDREARDGGATYLLPIMLDRYILDGWDKVQPALAERLRRRVIGDFSNIRRDRNSFDKAMNRVLQTLSKAKVTDQLSESES